MSYTTKAANAAGANENRTDLQRNRVKDAMTYREVCQRRVARAQNDLESAEGTINYEVTVLQHMQSRQMDMLKVHAQAVSMQLGLAASCADDVGDELVRDIATRLADQGL